MSKPGGRRGREGRRETHPGRSAGSRCRKHHTVTQAGTKTPSWEARPSPHLQLCWRTWVTAPGWRLLTEGLQHPPPQQATGQGTPCQAAGALEGRFPKQVFVLDAVFPPGSKGWEWNNRGAGAFTAPRAKCLGGESRFSSLWSWQQPDCVVRAQAEGRGVPILPRTGLEWICREHLPSDPNWGSRGSPPVPRGSPGFKWASVVRLGPVAIQVRPPSAGRTGQCPGQPSGSHLTFGCTWEHLIQNRVASKPLTVVLRQTASL